MSSRLSKWLGTDTKKPPEKSETEKQLDQLNLDALTKQSEIQDMLFPFILEGMGLQQTTDPETGEMRIVKSESAADPRQLALNDMDMQIREESGAQVLAGLQGKLDIDPSVEEDINRGKSQLREELYRKLGPGAEGSDAWNRAISEYERGANSLRYGLRHGQMNTADAISSNRENMRDRRGAMEFSRLQGATNPYLVSADALGQGASRQANERWRVSDFNERTSNRRSDRIMGMIRDGAAAYGTYTGMNKPPTGG